MKKIYLLLLIIIVANINATAQVSSDIAIQLQAKVQTTPAQITINWLKLAGTTSYQVSRKAKEGIMWNILGVVNSADSFYTDLNVAADSAYEYRVLQNGGLGATGYIYAGIRSLAIHNRGAILVLADTLFRDSCAAELTRLMNDLRGDGWQVFRKDVSRSESVPNVKNIIKGIYQNQPSLKAVLLVGHIPVPYSGQIYPDGHPDHEGAWAADVYYGDMDGTWTDTYVNLNTASRPENRNIPGDGKFDQSQLPTALELQVSRIDFSNMPAFAKTEVTMMKSYLNRDHQYKMDSLTVIKRGLVDDNFGYFGGEAFAANAWRAFPCLVGRDSIQSLDFIGTLNTSSYQWAYGCGGGSYNSAGGIGGTGDFAVNNTNSIFTMLFGSYFGDWDSQNNFLRAPLCSNIPALANVWAGRPNCFFHHMALGESIGYATKLSQDNSYLYEPTNYGAVFIHTALMGDGSLRTDYIKPVSNLQLLQLATGGAQITWTASPDAAVAGYYVYRADSVYGFYKQISNMLTATSFNDLSGTAGKKYYLVRPVKLQNTPSGNYYNLGLGKADSMQVSYVGINNIASVIPSMSAYPNPAGNTLHLLFESATSYTAPFEIMDIAGRMIINGTRSITKGHNDISIRVDALMPGIYLVKAAYGNGYSFTKFVKN